MASSSLDHKIKVLTLFDTTLFLSLVLEILWTVNRQVPHQSHQAFFLDNVFIIKFRIYYSGFKI